MSTRMQRIEPVSAPARRRGAFSRCLQCNEDTPEQAAFSPVTQIRQNQVDEVVQVVEIVPRQTPIYPAEQPIPKPIIDIEKHPTKKLLILDLDETLVHASFEPVSNADHIIDLTVTEPVSAKYTLYLFVRPYLDLFLEEMSKVFELAVFTASMQLYCDAVLDKIDPKRLIKYRLYRNHCVQRGPFYVKDISRLGHSLKDAVIMDNAQISFQAQPENGILCPEFLMDKEDNYLKTILPFMRRLADAEDVRILIKK